MHVKPAGCPLGSLPPCCSCVVCGCRCMVWSSACASATAPAAASPPSGCSLVDWRPSPLIARRGSSADCRKRAEVLPHGVCIVLRDSTQERLVRMVHVLTHADGAIACLSNLHACPVVEHPCEHVAVPLELQPDPQVGSLKPGNQDDTADANHDLCPSCSSLRGC